MPHKNSQQGQVAIEYALAMVLIFGFLSTGMPLLFDACVAALEIFVGHLQPHYP